MLDFTLSSGTDVCHIQFFSLSPIDLLLKVELQKAFGNYKGTVEWFYESAKKGKSIKLMKPSRLVLHENTA